MSQFDVAPDDVAMSFKQVGISTLFPPRPILSNVSGFVRKGGITASKLLDLLMHRNYIKSRFMYI